MTRVSNTMLPSSGTARNFSFAVLDQALSRDEETSTRCIEEMLSKGSWQGAGQEPGEE